MTAGHHHRHLHLNRHGTLAHLLQTPLTHTLDFDRVERSRWVWSPGHRENIAGDGPLRTVLTWRLTPLGILHTLTGLTICDNPTKGHPHP